MTMLLQVGMLLSGSVQPIGTRTLASGRYIAAQHRGTVYSVTMKPAAVRVWPLKWLVTSTWIGR